MTTYRVAQTMMGHAIVMRDDEGFDTTIEVGIKRYDVALKKRDRWEREEAKARRRATPTEDASHE